MLWMFAVDGCQEHYRHVSLLPSPVAGTGCSIEPALAHFAAAGTAPELLQRVLYEGLHGLLAISSPSRPTCLASDVGNLVSSTSTMMCQLACASISKPPSGDSSPLPRRSRLALHRCVLTVWSLCVRELIATCSGLKRGRPRKCTNKAPALTVECRRLCWRRQQFDSMDNSNLSLYADTAMCGIGAPRAPRAGSARSARQGTCAAAQRQTARVHPQLKLSSISHAAQALIPLEYANRTDEENAICMLRKLPSPITTVSADNGNLSLASPASHAKD